MKKNTSPDTELREWDDELKRQCGIRHLPYSDVHYLVSEILSLAIAKERERIGREAKEASSDDEWGEGAEYIFIEKLREIINPTSPKEV